MLKLYAPFSQAMLIVAATSPLNQTVVPLSQLPLILSVDPFE